MAKNTDSVIMGATDEVRGKKGHNIIPKIISVILAFILWFYVMVVESPVNSEDFKSIPIEVTLPIESDLTIYSGANATVNITVSGKRSELNRISESSFKAVADASAYTQAGKYSIPIHISVPDGITLVDQSISILSVYLDAKTTAPVPVQVKLTEYILDEGLELGGESEITKSVSEVMVSGPKSVLDTIETARVIIPCGKITSAIRASGNVELLDAYGSVVVNPYVTMDVNTVDVRVPVIASKEIPLKVNFKNNLLNDSNSDVTLTPSTVKVRGSADIIQPLEEYVIYTIDEKTLTSDKLSIPLSLPEGVQNPDGVGTVDVIIEHKGTSTKTFTVNKINVLNPNELDYELTSQTMEVTLRGRNEDLETITAEDLTLTVDLGVQSAGAGSVNLPVDVKVATLYSRTVYEIGEYNMLVTVK